MTFSKRHLLLSALILTLGMGPRTALAVKGAPACPVNSVSTGTAGVQELEHPVVTLIFWGSQWNSQIPSASNITGQIQNVLNGPYQALLNQYRTASGALRIARMTTVAPTYSGTNTGTAFQEADLLTAVQNVMSVGWVPPASPSVENIYVVLTPAGVKDANAPTAAGVHRSSSVGGTSFLWAWVGDPNGTNDYSSVFGRELVNTITDPNSGSGITLNTSCGNGLEIGDVCTNVTTPEEGYTVQAYYSAADHTCVIPESYSAVWRYNGAAFNWTAIGGNARQIYAGYYNGSPTVAATDPSGNVWLYTGSSPTWTQIGGVGCATLAIVDDSIYCLLQDTKFLFRYTGGTTWASIALPNGQASAIFGGGARVVSTDAFGDVASYSTSSSSWTVFGGSGHQAQQVVANDTAVYYLALNYAGGFKYQGGTLSALNAGGADIFGAGGPNDLLALPIIAVAGYPIWDGIQARTSTSSGWTLLSSPFTGLDSFAIAGSSLYALSGDQTSIKQSNNPQSSGAGWTAIGAATTKLIPQGNTLYAAGSVVY